MAAPQKLAVMQIVEIRKAADNPIPHKVFAQQARVNLRKMCVAQIPDAARLSKVLKARLKEYNATLPKPLALVFFADAVEHVCRIARLLRQPRGSPLGLPCLIWSSHVALNWDEVEIYMLYIPIASMKRTSAYRWIGIAGRRVWQRETDAHALCSMAGRLPLLPA